MARGFRGEIFAACELVFEKTSPWESAFTPRCRSTLARYPVPSSRKSSVVVPRSSCDDSRETASSGRVSRYAMARCAMGRFSRYTCPADAAAKRARKTATALFLDRVAAIGCLLAAMRRVTRTARSADRLHRGVGLRPVAGGRGSLEGHRRV